jgi:hypothetical protein
MDEPGPHRHNVLMPLDVFKLHAPHVSSGVVLARARFRRDEKRCRFVVGGGEHPRWATDRIESWTILRAPTALEPTGQAALTDVAAHNDTEIDTEDIDITPTIPEELLPAAAVATAQETISPTPFALEPTGQAAMTDAAVHNGTAIDNGALLYSSAEDARKAAEAQEIKILQAREAAFAKKTRMFQAREAACANASP